MMSLWCAPTSHLFSRTRASTAADFTVTSNVKVLYLLHEGDYVNCIVVKIAFG